MNVLVVTNMYPTPAEPWWGCFVCEQVDDLRTLGVHVTVIAFDGRRRRREYARAASRTRRAVAARSFDVVHAHYGLSGAVALAQRRLPVVTTFHGADTGYVRWQQAVSLVVARLTTPVFVSAEGARDLRLRSATVIPMGVDTTLFAPADKAAARGALGWRVDVPYVLFPGARHDLRKRPDLFDAAVREARRVHPEIRTASLEGAPREQVAQIMNAVDVTLMTSDQEGSPVAVRESLACGTPVVSVPVGDVEEQLAGLPACAVVPRDPAALGAALVASLQSSSDGSLRARAEETSRARVAERTAELYAAVVGR